MGSVTLPAGPVPLMPNRLWSCTASELRPQDDSSIACAIVTEAGTPQRCCAAIAPGAIWLMKACCARVWGVAGESCAEYFRYGPDAAVLCGLCVPADVTVPADVAVPAGVTAPGMFASPAPGAGRLPPGSPGPGPETAGCAGSLGSACGPTGVAGAVVVPGIAAAPGGTDEVGGDCVGPAAAAALSCGATAPGIIGSGCAAALGAASPDLGVLVTPGWLRAPGSVAAGCAVSGAASARWPLSTNPATPWSASGAGKECALTEKFGSESPPIVSSTPSL